MSPDELLENFSETIKTILEPDIVWDALSDFAANFEIDALTYYHIAPPGSADFSDKYFAARGYDKELVSQHRRSHDLFGNPFVSSLNHITAPILWRDMYDQVNCTEKQKGYFKELYCCSAYSGILIPAFGPNGRDGCTTFRLANTDKKLSRLNVYILSLASYVSHIQFCILRVKTSQNDVHLTAREQEVLKWVALGKSNTVIADIVGISQHTVNGYLRRIYLKTRTSDRTSAALRAVADSLIEF